MVEPTRLPVVPRPENDERLSSWLNRLAKLYSIPLDRLLDDLGLGGRSVFDLEWRLSIGEGVLIAGRTGLSPKVLEAMTFHDYAPKARMMIAHKNRHHCQNCPTDVHTRAGAMPWTFICPEHGTRYLTATGQDLKTLIGSDEFAILDQCAKRGAARLDKWMRGKDNEVPSIDSAVNFLATRHRRSSPPTISEQPRLSLQARRENHAFLTQSIIRQALLIMVPEYDRVAPLFVKPVRAGFHALSQSSLLQAYALAIGIDRLTNNPINSVIDVLMSSDQAGEMRLREVLKQWPLSLRRCIYARLWRTQRDERERQLAEKRDKRSKSHKLRFIPSHYYRYGISYTQYEKWR